MRSVKGLRSSISDSGFALDASPVMLSFTSPVLGLRSRTLETRPYFVMGDLAVNIVTGVVVALGMAALFGPSWNGLLAMIVAMALGTLISMPIGLVGGVLFGAMELMIPVMLTGMVAGMVVSKAAVTGAIGFGWAARTGGVCGVAVVVVSYLANSLIKRRATHWTS